MGVVTQRSEGDN